ncbi:MAG TPA: dihydrofolate reductase family protein [Bacillales bacterium]|nr:dihydrofolate reductase family protein [Bacillales bacterium]
MTHERTLVFYGAVSVDGYIARENHSLDWLFGTEGEEEIGFDAFYETIDTVVMGKKTYDQILVHDPETIPYESKECYVFSRNTTGSAGHVKFINNDIVAFMKGLKQRKGKKIWVVGGGEVLQPMMEEKLVDEFIIQITPTILGRGIPLFLPCDVENELKLVDVHRHKQFAEVHYVLKPN